MKFLHCYLQVLKKHTFMIIARHKSRCFVFTFLYQFFSVHIDVVVFMGNHRCIMEVYVTLLF